MYVRSSHRYLDLPFTPSFLGDTQERGELYFVFEYMPDGNLFDVIQREGKSGELTEARIKSIMHQLLSGCGARRPRARRAAFVH